MTSFEDRLSHTLSSAYNIERELGGGGMSRVFVATDRILGRKIVIKVLSPELTAEVNRGRFRREMQVAAQLQHPHIVTLLSAGEQDDLLYFTMPFIKGESLKTKIEKDGPMSVPDVLRVVHHVGEALDYAHQAGIVHRDIKPANILMSGSYSMITDFGVAKALNAAMPSSQGMTATGMAIGTPAYMAPEQLAGDASADHRIDIYAVGLLAYELLNGKSPFAGTTPQRMLAAVLTQDPQPLSEVRPDVPKSLSDVVMLCLSKEPERRPATARELLNSLNVLSSLSGDVSTLDRRVAHLVHTPTPDSGTTPVVILDDILPATERTFGDQAPPADPVSPVDGTVLVDGAPSVSIDPLSGEFGTPGYEAPGYETPKKSRAGMYAGIVVVLAMITIGGFWMSQRGGSATPPVVAASPAPGSVIPDSISAQSVPPPPAAESSVVAIVPAVDSQAVRDSLKRRQARRDSVRKDSTRKALAKVDSSRKVEVQVQQDPADKARRAVAGMLSNASATEMLSKGATHMGGVLNTKRMGDLQTQINALTPFLSQAGLSYAQFKEIAQGSGVNIFDEFGRIVPDALKRFASGH
ncbi:MAG: protein kinase [Gemmatimonadaceae bacterium]